MNHSRWVVSPEIVRQVLELSDTHKREFVMDRFGVSHTAIYDWRRKRSQAAAEGRVWPSDEDIATYRAQAAKRTATRRWRKRYQTTGHLLVDATGTRRRVRALAAIGWRYQDIAEHLGWHRNRVAYLATDGDWAVHRDAAEQVAKVYDRLAGTRGPSPLTAGRAKARGWPVPLAWGAGDEIDDPGVRPTGMRSDHEPSRLYRNPDLEDRVMVLTRAGLSAAEIAVRLRISQRQVVRVRSRNRQEDVA